VRTGCEELDIYIDPGEIKPLTRLSGKGKDRMKLSLAYHKIIDGFLSFTPL
jgi:hypothetical protein